MSYHSGGMQMVTFTLAAKDFTFFRQAIEQRAGIVLSEAKRDLLQSRLRSRMLELGYGDFAEYRSYLQSLPDSHDEWQLFINQLTTNKTDWFREPAHFDFLEKTYLPRLLARGQRTLKIWVAASSTGEEAYTLAMIVALKFPELHLEILATDIDTEVLSHAANAVYQKATVLAQVPKLYQPFAFSSGKEDLQKWVKVKRFLHERVTFAQLNLLHFPYKLRSEFDLVFCRNVFIYFSAQTVRAITEAQYDVTKPGGLLLIGHSESLQASSGRWGYVSPSIYVKGQMP